jgi:hypothetical protein
MVSTTTLRSSCYPCPERRRPRPETSRTFAKSHDRARLELDSNLFALSVVFSLILTWVNITVAVF